MLWQDSRVNTPLDPNTIDKTPRIDWTSQIGVAVSLIGAALIATKLLAVAGWDPNTAFAILDKSGTTDVLVGSILAIMPSLLTFIVIFSTQRIESFIATKNPAERGALRLLQMVALLFVSYIVPVAQFASVLTTILFYYLLKFFRTKKSKKGSGTPQARKRKQKDDQSITRFEANTVATVLVTLSVFASLSTPWMPSEQYKGPDGKDTGYVLSDDGSEAYVLNKAKREVVRLPSKELMGTLCTQGKSWATSSLATYLKPQRYESCSN